MALRRDPLARSPEPEELLSTKLQIPQPHHRMVPRPRIVQRIEASTTHRLCLVSAPAGSGKTTVLAAWARETVRPAAWLSLDADENDPLRFLAYLAAAIGSTEPELRATIVPRGVGDQHTQDLVRLLNRLSARRQPLAIVLDDYHVIEAEPVHRLVASLLEHAPPNLQVAVGTRTDPPLPLARLRGRGELLELREDDLRFTLDETTAYLADVVGAELSRQDTAALHGRTEGWIAGLQLAALSLPRHHDVSTFIRGFGGDQRQVVDYLEVELLERQTPEVRSFLLRSSLLEELSGPLCDAVTGQEGSAHRLRTIEEANLFLMPLDERREWFRYHPLFREFLRDRLAHEAPGSIAELHVRASRWYAERGQLERAIDHALTARAFDRAAHLIGGQAARWVRGGQARKLLGWLEALPADVRRSSPGVLLAYGWALLLTGSVDEADDQLQEATRFVAAAEGPDALRGDLRGQLAALASLVACVRGQPSRAVALSEEALARLPPDEHFLRGIITMNVTFNLAGAYPTEADTGEAVRAFQTAARLSRQAGDVPSAALALSRLGEVQTLRGRLREASDAFQQALALPAGEAPPGAASAVQVGLGLLHYEWNELHAAQRLLWQGVEAGALELFDEPRWGGLLTLARLHRAMGALGAAHELLDRAEEEARGLGVVWMRTRVEACRAWFSLAEGRLDAARQWAQRAGLHPGGDITYLGIDDFAVLARVRAAEGSHQQALEILEWLHGTARAAGLVGSEIKLLTLEAAVRAQRSETEAARRAMSRALELAEPAGYIRTLADEGGPVARLLRSHQWPGISSTYLGKLLEAFAPVHLAVRVPGADPAEALSPREIEVLRLLARNLTYEQVGEQLVVTVNTVKTHLRHIYAKLGATDRSEAVARARERKLL